MRLGYGVSSKELVNYMDRVRPPFNVNRMAQAAAIAALDDQEHVQRGRELNLEGRRTLEQGFDRCGVKWFQSQANFVLIDLERPAMPIYEALLYKGFIVRPVANYGLPTCLRVTIGTQEQNHGFLAALEEVLAEQRDTQA
jgi:histidinol-phosphate aminotransferase